MPAHGDHILKHLKRVQETHGDRILDRLKQANGFDFDGEAVIYPDGHTCNARDCQNYLKSVREILGEASLSFARVQFMLSGCLGVDLQD